MTFKSPLAATTEQRAGLEALSARSNRAEAGRARALLPTLAGWTGARIGEAFGVREDTVRQWRSEHARDGLGAMKTRVAPGPPPVKTQAALRVAGPLLSMPVAGRPNWTLARLSAEIEAREGFAVSRAQLSKALRKKGAFDSAGRATRRRGGRTRARSSASACGSPCASNRPWPETSRCSSPTRARR